MEDPFISAEYESQAQGGRRAQPNGSPSSTRRAPWCRNSWAHSGPYWVATMRTSDRLGGASTYRTDLGALPLPGGERVGVRGFEAYRETVTPLPMGEGADRVAARPVANSLDEVITNGDAEGGRVSFSSTGRSLVDEDEIIVLSVGVDIGSSTSHLVFSRIVLERLDSRYVVSARETFYPSDILLTPSRRRRGHRRRGARRLHRQAPIRAMPTSIPTRSTPARLTLTGVAVRRRKCARAIGELFARQAGKMVAVLGRRQPGDGDGRPRFGQRRRARSATMPRS